MAKISVILYTSKKYKNGTSPIMLRVTKNKSLKYFKIGDSRFDILPKQWNKEFGLVKSDKRLNPEHNLINNYIKKKYNEAVKILDKFEEDRIAWTFNMFEQEYRNTSTTKKVKPFMLNRIEELKDQNKYNSARALQELLSIIEKHNPNFNKLYFQDIDYLFIERFYYYLKNERKNKDSSIGIALRGLRGILNEAINRNIGSKEAYPFSNIYGATKIFKISKLEKRKANKYVPKEYLKKILDAEILEPHLNWAKQLFLFSFFASGINFKDMAYLTFENVKSNIGKDGTTFKVIVFSRMKTKEQITIPITTQLESILSWAAHNSTSSNKYLLPIITNIELTGEKQNDHITNRRKRFNKHVKALAKKLEFPEELWDISSYYARHSYATTLLRNGAQIEKISEALGHTSTKTTQAYLESFGSDEIAKLNEGLLS